MNLENCFKKYEDQGFLKKEEIGPDQIRNLLRRADKNLRTARPILKIDLEAGFESAYNSVLKSGRALIYLHGYRPDDGQQHKTTIDLIAIILKDYPGEIFYKIDKMRRKRNQIMYAPTPELGIQEAENFITTAENFLEVVKKFLNQNHSQLSLF